MFLFFPLFVGNLNPNNMECFELLLTKTRSGTQKSASILRRFFFVGGQDRQLTPNRRQIDAKSTDAFSTQKEIARNLGYFFLRRFCVDCLSYYPPPKKIPRNLVFFSCSHCTKLRDIHSSFVIVVTLRTPPPHTMLINMVIFT